MSDTPPPLVPKIRLRGVTKRFGDKLVLDGIDLDVAPRTSMVVIGGSGSGKSVLIKCILGLIEPDAGSIEIDGQDVLRMAPREREAVRAGIGMLFQAGALFDSISVADNVAFGVLAQKKATRAEARKITWTTWKETWITSMMVFIMCVMAATFFFGLDKVLSIATAALLQFSSAGA